MNRLIAVMVNVGMIGCRQVAPRYVKAMADFSVLKPANIPLPLADNRHLIFLGCGTRQFATPLLVPATLRLRCA